MRRVSLMSLSERVRDLNGSLTDVEQGIVTAIVAAAGDAAFLSAAEIAARTSVHETTVTRLARKLGYAGYRELRADVRGGRSDGPMSDRARSRGQGGYLLAEYMRDEAEALMRVADLVDQQHLDEVADTIVQARRVYVAGLGTLVDCLARRLRRFGLDVRTLSGTDRSIAAGLIGMNPQDTLFAFGIRPVDPAIRILLSVAEDRGARTIVLSDTPGVDLPVTPTRLLTVLRGADDNFRTLVVPTAFCYALELAIYHRHKDVAADSLVELDEVAGLLGTRFKPASRHKR